MISFSIWLSETTVDLKAHSELVQQQSRYVCYASSNIQQDEEVVHLNTLKIPVAEAMLIITHLQM